jgi:hypothetical protein
MIIPKRRKRVRTDIAPEVQAAASRLEMTLSGYLALSGKERAKGDLSRK